MAAPHKLTDNFTAFFKRINPSPTYVNAASSAQSEIRSLIESKDGPAGDLKVKSFIQGSYGRHTAIHTINDVDIVALCSVSYKPTANKNTRDQIFDMVASSIASNGRYRNKIHYDNQSICVKVMLEGVKVEILPALRVSGKPFEFEPFYMCRPSSDRDSNEGTWEHAYARYHQERLSEKNQFTNGLFIPMIKVLKHIRSTDSQLIESDAVSYHIECLLYAVRNAVYAGSTCDCIEGIFTALAGFTSSKAASSGLRTPCQHKQVFDEKEWTIDCYEKFHNAVQRWQKIAMEANSFADKEKAILTWKKLLGDKYFPRNPQHS